MLHRLLGIHSEKNARSAAELSAVMAFGLAVYTGYLVHMSRIHNMPIPFYRPAEALFDAFCFVFLAAGIWLGIRLAGAAALALLLADQWFLFEKGSLVYQALLFVILVIMVRGAMAGFIPVPAVAGNSTAESSRTGTPRTIAAAGFLILLLAAGTGGWLLLKGNPLKTEKGSAEKTPLSFRATDSGLSRFELVTGETVHGKIIREDDVYYQLDVQGNERILIKEDIKATVIADD